VDYFMMMHPAAVNAMKKTINDLMNGTKPTEITDWVTVTIGGK
jgi:CO dehydrogenase/acetyl-CoA synthase delta subunit